MSGNELIIQGGLEAGFHLYTGYPGSPLADFFNILNEKKDQLNEKGIKVVIANSEANAAAMASGAKQAGKHCLVAMKSMGLHVASDALSVGNFANPGPEKTGTVIVVGDDPWSMSTSTPADSRYLFKHLHIPFLEPSTPEELKNWMKTALEISKETSVYQGLLLTTFMAEGGGRVSGDDWQQIDSELIDINTGDFDLSKNVMVPPNSLMADVSMIKERFPKVTQVLEKHDLDIIHGKSEGKMGVISSGVIYETVNQIMEESGLLDHSSLYKLACSYPLTEKKLLPWLKGLDHLVVIEEKRGFLENELREFCSKHQLSCQVYGKDHFQAFGGLTYEHVKEQLFLLSNQLGVSNCQYKPQETFRLETELPRRLPTFCPGCPHRETLSLLKDLRKKLKKEGVDLISHGDVGCYSLSFLPPFKEMHNLSAMGQGGALGAGFDIFTKNPSVVLMGDSTFFHSGMTDISNSVQLGHNITYILLDNDNTAMTGHQMTPRTGVSVDGRKRPKQDMIHLTRSLGVKNIIEVNPSDRYFYQNLLMETVKKEGVKVIVSNKECGLTFHGRQKSKERNLFKQNQTVPEKVFYQVNTLACEDCRECVEMTGCPGLTQIQDAYGDKIKIDTQICVGDSYCTKLKACPSFEKVVVKNYHPTLHKKKNTLTKQDIPLPTVSKSFDDIVAGKDLRVVITGVGGSGVTTISRILAEASKSMGGRTDLDFKFMDQKGLAQRNGNVTGHMTIFKKGLSRGAITPLGTADLLLSPDLIDGSNQLRFLSKEGLAIFDQDYQVPLSMILDKNEFKPGFNGEEHIEHLQKIMGDHLRVHPMKKHSEKEFGKSVYASAVILGVAFQEGRLPFSLEDLESAFTATMRKEELDNNLQAFHLGREICHLSQEEAQTQKQENKTNLSLYYQSLEESLLPFHHKKIMVDLYKKQLERLVGYFPEIPEAHLARYLHDLYIFDRGSHAEQFISEAFELKTRYEDLEHLKMALRILCRTYFIKDEVMVSHLMISPLHTERQKKKFDQWTSSPIQREFINRPSFDLFGKKIEFDISPRVWMLKIMRQMRWLRLVLPGWHSKEKKLSLLIRDKVTKEIFNEKDIYQALKKCENVKGYREIRYEKASEYLGINL